MTVFKLILVLLTVLLSILLIHKLWLKHEIIEGLVDSTAKKNEMEAVKGDFAPQIVVPAYIVKASHPRPPLISMSDRFKNSQDKMQMVLLKQRLRVAESQYNATRDRLRTINKPTFPKKPKNKRDYKANMAYSRAMVNYNTDFARYDISRTTTQRQLDGMLTQIRSINDSIKSMQSRIDNFNAKVKSYMDAVEIYNQKNDSDSHKNYRLKDLFVKSSYNSASTGKYMNSEMVKLLLERGCRYLDFEVINSKGTLYVTDSSIKLDKNNRITLTDALRVINRSLTKGDPVYINLRLSKTSITYNNLKSTLNVLPTELRYSGRPIDDTTRISEIRGKCIIIADKDIKDSRGKSAVDIVINKSKTGLYSYQNSVIASLSGTTDPVTKRMTVVEPNSIGSLFNTSDISVRRLVREYKANFTPQRFYKRSDVLTKYESIFNSMKCSHVAIKYLDNALFNRLDAAADIVK
jgi:hypothetical protein